jgi:hypothetical protein
MGQFSGGKIAPLWPVYGIHEASVIEKGGERA